MENFEERMRNLARRSPGMPLADAIRILDANPDLDITSNTHAAWSERAEWVLEHADIMDLCDDKGKIHAIKEIRMRTHMGLKDAKEALEHALVLRASGHMTLAQRQQLEIDEQEAIRSIVGT